MTPPEHREAAERLLAKSRDAAAQVHVSLAILDVLTEIRDLIKGTPAGGES